MSKYLQKSRFHRKIDFSAIGVLGDDPYTLDGEGKLRLTIKNAGAGNTLIVEARLFDDDVYTTVHTSTGNGSEIVDISTWDQIRFRVDNYGGSQGTMIVTGFFTIFLNEPIEVTGTVQAEAATIKTPTIQNISVATKDTEQSIVLPSTTKKFSFRVRNGTALAKLSYTSGQSGTTYWTVTRGSTYTEKALELSSSLTIYFQLTRDSQEVEVVYWE